MFLKIYALLSFILLSKASQCPKYTLNRLGYCTFRTTIFGTTFWDGTVISNVTAMLTNKNGTQVFVKPVPVRNNTRFSLDFFFMEEKIDFVALIHYTRNGTEAEVKSFNIPENCERSSQLFNRYVVTMFFEDDYFCFLGIFELK
uniref:Secreted protein n=1 Tax=Strongyloides venezuelensis TaxID=75913 RepID=A0A0K0FT66_STRVS